MLNYKNPFELLEHHLFCRVHACRRDEKYGLCSGFEVKAINDYRVDEMQPVFQVNYVYYNVTQYTINISFKG